MEPEERVVRTEGAPPAYHTSDDEGLLHRLGYAQELFRAMGGFRNFAISFTIISILAGCLTSYNIGFEHGGPMWVVYGWLLVGLMATIISLSMAEIASAYPTAGGLYYWASKLGSPGWGWATGWFNLIGQVAVTAAIGYGLALFGQALFDFWFSYSAHMEDWFGATFDASTYILYALFLTAAALINLLNIRLTSGLNMISAWWHMIFVLVIVAILIIVPNDHQSVSYVFTETVNNSGYGGSTTSFGLAFLLVLGLGMLLPQYTITGFDASAHTAEETRGASIAAAQGVWRSVFWSAVIGWFVLLALLFAATDVNGVNDAGGASNSIVTSALSGDMWAAKMILIIVTVGQLFCGAAGLTSASRTWYAFSRDRGMPGWWLFRRLNRDKVPLYAVMAVSVAALIITIPALWSTAAAPTFPWAFFAIVGICTVGLYIAYTIPVYLRLRRGASFEVGPWNLGRHYRWINPTAIVWVILTVIIFCLPYGPASVPWFDEFDAPALNYTPMVLVVGAIVAIWWLVSAKNRYTGPVRTLEEDEVTRG